MSRYNVQFLDDKDFESLPYKDVDVALGLADSKTGQAYVRRTGVDVMDVFTAMHELEHLEEGEHGAHADHQYHKDGVYYKLPFLMPLLTTGLSSLIGGGISKLMAPKQQQQQQQPQMQMPSMPQVSQGQNPMAQFGGKPNVVAPQASPIGGSGGASPQGGPIDMLNKKKAGYAGGMM